LSSTDVSSHKSLNVTDTDYHSCSKLDLNAALFSSFKIAQKSARSI